jgi:DNA-binding transcriptional ArsR family regulator
MKLLHHKEVTTMKHLDGYNKHETEQHRRIVRENKILECLKGRELNYKQIMQETKLKYPSVVWTLRALEQAETIKSRFVDGTRLHSINDPLPSSAIL